MKKKFSIALYADSLGLPRKNAVNYNERYIFLLEKFIREKLPVDYFEIKDRAKGAVTIKEIMDQYEHDAGYYDLPGDVVVFQTGIVDCAPRPVNQETRDRIGRLPVFVRKLVTGYIHKNRSKILQKGNAYVRTEKPIFSKLLRTLIDKAHNDYKRVYVITICPTNQKIENHSPGFTKHINEYNDVIKAVVKDAGYSNVFLIDINAFINDRYDQIDNYILKEDGHHINAKAHETIAEMIIKHETDFLADEKNV